MVQSLQTKGHKFESPYFLFFFIYLNHVNSTSFLVLFIYYVDVLLPSTGLKQGSHRNSKTQFHDFSMIFHDQQCSFHDY